MAHIDYSVKIAAKYGKKDSTDHSFGDYNTKKKKGGIVEERGCEMITYLILQIARDKYMRVNGERKVDFGVKNLIKIAGGLQLYHYENQRDKEDNVGDHLDIKLMNSMRLESRPPLASTAVHGAVLDISVKKEQRNEVSEFLKAQIGSSPSIFKTLKMCKIKTSNYSPVYVDDGQLEHQTLYEKVPTVELSHRKYKLKILNNV